MAKGKNMLGKFRGKVGATVFRTEAGIGQIASEYNPNPKNPRTMLQTKQRSKMNLAGQISRITPAAVISGLNNNGRMARSLFVSKLLRACSVADDEALTTTVNFADVKYSVGPAAGLTATATYDDNVGSLKVGLVFSTATSDVTGAMIVVVFAGADGTFMGDFKSAARNQTTVNVNIPIPYPQGTAAVAHVYVIPTLETSTGVVVDFAAMSATNIAYTASAMRSLAAAEALAESIYIGFTDVPNQ